MAGNGRPCRTAKLGAGLREMTRFEAVSAVRRPAREKPYCPVALFCISFVPGLLSRIGTRADWVTIQSQSPSREVRTSTSVIMLFTFRRRKVRLHPVGRIHSYMLLGIHKNLSLALRCIYFVYRGPRLNTPTRNAGAQRPRATVRAIALLMSSGLRFSLWLRWFVVIAWLAQLHHHVGLAQPAYLSHVLSAALLLAVNTLVLYRVETKRGVTWRWALALSAMDLALLTGGLTVAIGSEGAFFVLYYAALAMFAAVSSSFRVTLLATTVVAAVHAALSLSTGPGGTLEIQPDPVLLLSILAMYAAVSAVSLVSRFERNRSWFERVRRREAVERGEELQQERIELSQTIHNTIAQSAYLIGLGLETAIELADGLNDESRDELLEKLEATLALSRSTMWDLRHPINVGPIFEGRELGRVLRSHASTFSTITSIPTEVVQVGQEPLLSVLTRRLLLSIAHNALSNAHRHSNADNITIELFFDNSTIRLSVTDDGIGLPSDYCLRGQGFRNMRLDAERMGGWLEAGPGKSGRGTTITCVVPLGSDKGGP